LNISHEDLLEYLNRFKEEQRETVYKCLLDSEILEKAFSQPEGKLILSQAIDVITTNVIKIVTKCADKDPKTAVPAIYPACMEINLAHKMLVGWAKVLGAGKDHKTKIKEMKNAR
jgi:hypothetical protein